MDKLDCIVKVSTPFEGENNTHLQATSKGVQHSTRTKHKTKRVWDEIQEPPRIKRNRHDVKGNTGLTTDPDSEDEREHNGSHLSEYELKRLETIRQNQAFLSSLHLPQIVDSLRPKKRNRLVVEKEKVVKEALPPRQSLRLQHKDAEVVTGTPNVLPEPKKLEGPVPMCPLNLDDGSSLPEDMVRLWAEEPVKYHEEKMNLESYKEGLQKMHLQDIVKVVMDRTYTTAFHPCTSSLLMAAGDLRGKIGIWNMKASWGDKGVLLFEPHTNLISCMKFSKSQPTTLVTTSCDGTARVTDVERATFDEVYRLKNLRTFDFLSDDGTTLLMGSTDGSVAIVDMRTPGTSHESLHVLDSNCVRCVDVHPLQRQYFVAAEHRDVHIYDIRCLKASKAVSELSGHSRCVSYAYFSPVTGNRVLTTCYDDQLRVFYTSRLVTSPPMTISIRHNNQTGRFLSKMEAVWDPKQEDCFAVGCMERPRRLEVYHETGKLLHTFQTTTVCPVVAFHPSRFALVGGNSSGRLHVFT